MPFHCMSKTSVQEAEAQQNLKNYAPQKKKKKNLGDTTVAFGN